jgi:hypothetical protein
MCASISFRYAKIGIFFEKEKMRKRENENLFENERITKNKKMMDLKKKSAILLEQKENRTIFAP